MLYVRTFINGGIGDISVLKLITNVICPYIHKWRNRRHFSVLKSCTNVICPYIHKWRNRRYFSVLKSFTNIICPYIHKWRNRRCFSMLKSNSANTVSYHKPSMHKEGGQTLRWCHMSASQSECGMTYVILDRKIGAILE